MSSYDRDNLEDAVRDFFYVMRGLSCNDCPIEKATCLKNTKYDNCEQEIIHYYMENEGEL